MLARRAAEAAVDELARNVVIVDLRSRSDAVDFFILCSALSDVHIQAIASGIEKALRAQGVKTHHREGQPGSRWVLLDYIDVVIHVFHPATREFYAIEELWGDAPMERMDDGPDLPEEDGEDDIDDDLNHP